MKPTPNVKFTNETGVLACLCSCMLTSASLEIPIFLPTPFLELLTKFKEIFFKRKQRKNIWANNSSFTCFSFSSIGQCTNQGTVALSSLRFYLSLTHYVNHVNRQYLKWTWKQFAIHNKGKVRGQMKRRKGRCAHLYPNWMTSGRSVQARQNKGICVFPDPLQGNSSSPSQLHLDQFAQLY